MKNEFYVSRRAVWLGVFIICAVWATYLVKLAFYIWG